MYSKFSLGFSFLLFATCYISRVSSLLCYVCTTKNPHQKDCLNIPEGSVKYLQNCIAPKNQTCRLQTQWIDFELSEGKI
ncbi:uncharacterized protein NPIL_700611 [Nephila pilipes]|uniref:Uncharacterized protein n=1 Tax=Nephila pilipes TaxID=299642 RepID=A0A8X6MX13_NEPPI|nr:uncharacterized protein NPIL_700611 [Nephila pilipes]